MCVTNTTKRNPVKLSVQSKPPSAQAQRICNSLFLPTITTSSSVPVKPVVADNNTKKRVRKPQKPGKTAKNHDRHFVIHSYHDHSLDQDDSASALPGKRRRGGVSVSFPMKLHQMLEQIEKDGLGHIISWQPHGRCFVVHKPKQFVDEVLQQYFKQSKMTSFQRQLNLYGFQRLTRGNDAGGYYHELFLRGKTFLVKGMTRTKVKGTGFKAASSPDQEPDFWSMTPVNPVTPPQSEDDASAHSQESEEHNAPLSSTCFSYSPVVASSSSSSSAIPSSFSFEPPPSNIRTVEEMVIEPIPLASASSSSSDSEVLDEVVDELFLHEPPEENDNILDFVNMWNPDSFVMNEEIVDDYQLGVMLERILAE